MARKLLDPNYYISPSVKDVTQDVPSTSAPAEKKDITDIDDDIRQELEKLRAENKNLRIENAKLGQLNPNRAAHAKAAFFKAEYEKIASGHISVETTQATTKTASYAIYVSHQ
ncbi:hypothetical protein Pyn_32785 [Prunus yedoensis var. nudiflora]|uniref:Uncharacterized protein n=1 Tax=Prunus yedoensis var. nudiflora TaxID=2094558 RepID=A0A314YWV3_PRUYE|nr:hypothetical protein Pyn_32785 [Prunus yedoensis var. nudiflora]